MARRRATKTFPAKSMTASARGDERTYEQAPPGEVTAIRRRGTATGPPWCPG